MRPLLLVIGTGRREFREYLLQSIHQQYRVHLFAASEPGWELPYLDGHTLVDTSADSVTAAKEIQAREPISGVLCWDEARILRAGEVAQSLGLPGDPAAIARCGEKHLTRQALAAAGVPQPALLEESVEGEEISVDVAVHSGEIFPLCLARRTPTGHYVHAEDSLLHDPVLFRLLHDTHRALGFYDGVSHTEIVMSAEGPQVIGVSGRLGGDVIPYLGLKATGVDAGLAAAAVVCGRAPLVERDRKLVAAVRFFHGKAPVRFDSKGLPDSIDRLEVLTGTGPMGRTAFATAVAATADECTQALDAAEAALRAA